LTLATIAVVWGGCIKIPRENGVLMQLKATASEDGCRFTAANLTTRKVIAKTPNRPAGGSSATTIPGVADLWAQTRGDRRIRVALLDGQVDIAHRCFHGAYLTLVESAICGDNDKGPARRHGTHLASVIFGQPKGGVPGLAPECHGLFIPIFASASQSAFRLCSQWDLAHGIALAVRHGAHVINISGGELSLSGEAEPLLNEALADCQRRGVLIVAAVGNDGCPCLHVPAAHAGVLAVGAMDKSGVPLPFSNWGWKYHTHGIVAPGQDILGARPGGGTAAGTGSSYAAAVVSGVAALLLSLQLKRGQHPNPHLVREALVRTAIDCATQPASDCRRLLAGRLDVRRSTSFVTGSTSVMSELSETSQSNGTEPCHGTQPLCSGKETDIARVEGVAPSSGVPATVGQVQPAACGCACTAAANGQLVYALGELGYDFVSQARMDSLAQKIAPSATPSLGHVKALDGKALLKHLKKEPWDAAAVTWTLNLHGTPLYAIQPAGPFAGVAYERLLTCLEDHLGNAIERVSVGGTVAGAVTLLQGQSVPVLVPEIRTMYSWTTAALARAVTGSAVQKRDAVEKFLNRVYHSLRNPGLAAPDRALNYVVTNALLVEPVFTQALKDKMELDHIQVTRSPYCRPGSDCWDVELYFFDPLKDSHKMRKVYRLTVDVSDVAPVGVGPMRAWSVR
jgi:hypothetical protein